MHPGDAPEDSLAEINFGQMGDAVLRADPATGINSIGSELASCRGSRSRPACLRPTFRGGDADPGAACTGRDYPNNH